MKTRKLLLKPMFIIGLIVLGGCYDFSQFDNIKVESISPKWVVPVVKSSITFNDLVEREDANTIIFTKPGDSRFFIAFRDTMDLFSAAERYSLPDFNFTKQYQLEAGEVPGAPLPPGQTLGPITKVYTETYNSITGAEVKYVKFSAGYINMVVTNNFQNSISATIRFNSIRDQLGNPLVFEMNTTPPGGTFTIDNKDLTGYSLYLSSGSQYNTLTVEVELTIHSQGNPISVTEDANIQISLTGLDFEYLLGNLNETFHLDDINLTLDAFNSLIETDIFLSEPKLTTTFENLFGIPLALSIVNFDATNTNTGQQVSLVNEGEPPTGSLLLNQPNNIKYLTSLEQQQPEVDSKYVDHNNSNLEDFLAIAPNEILISPTVTVGDATTNHDYFVRKTSTLRMINEIEFPLAGWIDNLVISDTVEVELPDLEEDLKLINDNALKIRLKFKFINSIPFNIYIQGYFLDDANTLLTKLYDKDSELMLVKSSAINQTTGKTLTPTTHWAYIDISKSRYDQMKNATKLVIQARLQTGGNTHQNVVVESTNTLETMFSVEFEGNVDLGN
ncbi:MAG TPA: hypothetical protein ENN49_11385 [Bacteroidales bacterium]|nr:hypothetical protein [Bacteroidales bacterium]